MGKVISFRPPSGKSPSRATTEVCKACRHKPNVHIRHPNGVISCAARGCTCETRPKR